MRAIFVCIMVTVTAVLAVISICKPEMLSANQFLVGFINHELLNILAIIVTVTAASVANIHLAFNRAEESAKNPGLFTEARKEVNGGALFLLALFMLTVIVMIVRSSFLGDATITAFFNSGCLVILLLNILIMIDITMAIFSIQPFVSGNDKQ